MILIYIESYGGDWVMLHMDIHRYRLMEPPDTWFSKLPGCRHPARVQEKSMEKVHLFLVHFSLEMIQLVPLIIPLLRMNHKGVWEM